MIYDSVENIEVYCDEGDALQKAVQYVLDLDLELADGKYEIQGDEIFALVQTVTTGAAEEKVFESHQRYLDVQMVVDGSERQDVVLLDGADIEVTQEYDSEKDVMFFKTGGNFSTLIMEPGMFVVYGPDDGHRPGCSVGESTEIRKVCVKIKIGA